MVKLGFYKCSNCGFYNSLQKHCMLKGCSTNNNDYCDRHNSNVYQCDGCGRLLTQPIVWQNGDTVNIFCKECFRKIIGG